MFKLMWHVKQVFVKFWTNLWRNSWLSQKISQSVLGISDFITLSKSGCSTLTFNEWTIPL